MSLVGAVLSGSLDQVEALLAAGADVNQKTHSGTPLQAAARLGHLEIAQALVRAGADLEAGNSLGTPLASALAGSHSALAMLLLDHGARPLGLETAAAHGLVAVVAALLRADAQVDERCTLHPTIPLSEFTPLHAACLAGHGEVVDMLLEAGANPHLRDGQGADAWELAPPAVQERLRQRGVVSQRSPEQALLAAAQAGDQQALQAALAHKPNLNEPDQRRLFRGFTALHLAALHGHEEVVEKLLAAGANPDPLDGEAPKAGLKQAYSFLGMEALQGDALGRTPLFGAARQGHLSIVVRLLRAGALANRQDFLGFSPLYLAAQHGHLAVVRALIEGGAEVDRGGPGKTSPLLVALENRQRDCARLLLQSGASIKGGSTTPIMQAAENADAELLQMMLDRKARLTAGKNSSPPLARVVGATHQVPVASAPPGNWVKVWNDQGGFATVPLPQSQILEAMEVLLQAGADPNATGFLGTPLMVAARYGLSQVVRRLLEAGADPRLTYKEDSALSLARLFGHQEVVSILKEVAAPTPLPPRTEAPSKVYVELPRPNFAEAAQRPEFRQAVEEMEQLCGSKALAKDYLRGGFELHVHSGRRAHIDTLDVQRRWLERGCFVFEPTYSSDGPETLAVLPCNHWSVALAVMQTDGVNCGLSPHDILLWLERLATRQPFALQTIARDTLAGVFLTPIADPKALAQSMYEFCPDIVDQGCQTVGALARELRKQPARLFFWWD